MDTVEEPKEEIKKSYEIAYLIPTEEANKDLVSVVTKHGAEVRMEGGLKQLRLAYQINKVDQAYFGYLQFRAVPEQTKQLEQALRSTSYVLRSLITTLPVPSTKNEGTGAPRAPRPMVRPPIEKKPVVAPALSNEALEKKIEEILQ